MTDTLKKARVQILEVVNNQGKKIHLSICEKESDTGFKFNERLFIWVEDERFGYLSKFQQSDDPKKIDINKCKVIVPIKNFKKAERSEKTLKLYFVVIEGEGKDAKLSKQWVLRFPSEQLATKWNALMNEEKARSTSKKHASTSKSKRMGDKSPKKSDLKVGEDSQVEGSKLKSQIKKDQIDKSKMKPEVTKDFDKSKKGNKQYKNQLYESEPKNNFILDEIKEEEPQVTKNESNVGRSSKPTKMEQMNIKKTDSSFINNPPQRSTSKQVEPGSKLGNDQNVVRKLQYQEEDENKKRKLQEQIRKLQQIKLGKQRQELQRKQKELEEYARKVKQEARQLEEKKKKFQVQQEKKKLEQEKKKYLNMQQEKRKNNEKQANRNQKLDDSNTKKGSQAQQRQREKESRKYKERVDNDEDGTIINENIFKKKISEQYSEEEREQIIENKGKNRQKLEGVNYTDIVNNVILSKNVPQPKTKQKQKKINSREEQQALNQKKLEEVHDYLFELEKLKMKGKQEKKQQEIVEKQEKKSQDQSRQLGWTFLYIIKQAEGSEYELVKQFNEFCANLLQQVVNQFHLPERKRAYLPKYKREQYYLYQKDDIQFKIAFIGLKQNYNLSQKDMVCNQLNVKKLNNQFKNYQVLYRAVRQTKCQSLKVPLACISEYQGFVAFFKASSQFQNQVQANLTNDKKFISDLQKISQETKISVSHLKSKQNVLVLKLNKEFYRQLGARLGKSNVNFDYLMVDQIRGLLPTDTLFIKHPYQQQQLSRSPYHKNENSRVIREQLLGFTEHQRENTNSAMLSNLKKNSNYKSMQSNLQKKKDEVEKNILQSIGQLIRQMDELMFFFTQPKQLSNRLHEFGINVRYLGLIYTQSQLKFTKSYIMTEMAGRAAKALLRKTIQDIHIQQNQQQSVQGHQHNIKLKIIDFLNCVVGSLQSQDTDLMWKLLSAHSLDYFNYPIQIQNIQKGYLLITLSHHLGIEFDWSKIEASNVFNTDEFFNDGNLINLRVRSKGYLPVLSSEQRQLIMRMQLNDHQAFKILQDKYRIQTDSLPEKFKHEKYFDIFRKYTSNFVPPDFTNQRAYKFLSIYSNSTQLFNKNEFNIKFTELKWNLKRQRKQKYINCFNEINQQVTNRFGDFHPLLSQLYDIMSLYHRNNGQFEDATTFSKSSVINMLKVCGNTHIKVGETYYQLANCCIRGGKKQEALISLQKAKNIFEFNEKQNSVEYAYVCLKLGLIFLSEGKTQETEQIIKFALSVFNKHSSQKINKGYGQQFEQERVQCYQVLSRCYQLDELTDLQRNLSFECQKQLHYVSNPGNLQKLLKVVLYPILSTLTISEAKSYIDLISQIPLQTSINTYMKSFQRISMRIQETTLIENLQSYLENLKTIFTFIKQKDSLKDWVGLDQVYERETVNDFVSLTEELIYFLGEGFYTGSIRDSLSK